MASEGVSQKGFRSAAEAVDDHGWRLAANETRCVDIHGVTRSHSTKKMYNYVDHLSSRIRPAMRVPYREIPLNDSRGTFARSSRFPRLVENLQKFGIGLIDQFGGCEQRVIDVRKVDIERAKPVKYFRNEEAGKSKIADGWFCTGEIVHQDEHGWFYFHHRAGGGVRRNGDFVNTALVESVLARAPMVADVFVCGVATPRNMAGEKMLVAAVVPVEPASFDRKAFLEYSRLNLEKNDVPEYVQVLEAIPKTVSEKPVERECIALLELSWLIEGGEAGAMPRDED